jgi:ankyrin repeat protein
MGERLNKTATEALGDVDVVCLLIDATQPFGPGDKFIAERVPKNSVLIVNKVDRAQPDQIMAQLAAVAELGFAEYFPVSARRGTGVPELVEAGADISAATPSGITPLHWAAGRNATNAVAYLLSVDSNTSAPRDESNDSISRKRLTTLRKSHEDIVEP